MAQAHRIKTGPSPVSAGILRFCKGVLGEIIFWLLTAIALAMMIALASFDIRDPAWTHTANVSEIHNLVGKVGAWFADVNLYFFGYPAYLLPLSLMLAGWRLFGRGALLQLDAEIVLFRVLGFAVAVTTACGFATLHIHPAVDAMPGGGSAGGLVGVHVGPFLIDAFGFVWGNLFMIALFLAGITLGTGLSWLKLLEGIGSLVLRPLAQTGHRGKQQQQPSIAAEGEERPPKPIAGQKRKSANVAESFKQKRPSTAPGLIARARSWWRSQPRFATNPHSPLDDPSTIAPADPPLSLDGLDGDVDDRKANRYEYASNPDRTWEGQAGRKPDRGPTGGHTATAPPPPLSDLTLIPTAKPCTRPVVPESKIQKVDKADVAGAQDGTRETVKSATVVALAARTPSVSPERPVAEGEPGMATSAARPVGELPPLDLLDQSPPHTTGYSVETLQEMSRRVEVLLKSFGIEARVVAVEPGPVITRFEVDPAPGVKVSQISNLVKDLARGLSVISVRVVEVIPGKSVIGLEIPNQQREIVSLRKVLESPVYTDSATPLTLALGVDIGGNPVVANLGRMPHLLVAGTTGSGKSVAINAMLLSLLYKASPHEVRLILVDPKMLELSMYEDIQHLLTPVVTDMKEAANALRWCVGEMERRYRLMAALRVRNIAGFNHKIVDALKEDKPLTDPLWKPEGSLESEPPLLQPLPFIVVVIDELADMMMIVGKKVEELIARLAQKARAAGIHLILATQRPSVDVITGLIKANIPTRIAFQVSSKVDSRTILDQMGAEQLLGHGDMLFLPPGTGLPQRVHGAFVNDHEVNKVVGFLRQNGTPNYIDEVLIEPREDGEFGEENENGGRGGESDPLYDEAVKIVTESRRASVSGVQRRLRIGYNRAARLVEEMETAGVVGPLQSNGSREVLAPAPP